jgi:hypothetical protein
MERTKLTKHTSIPLGLVALTFFLPMTDTCNHAVSPLAYIRESGFASGLWIAPTFATAAILTVAVIRSAFGRAPKTTAATWATTALVTSLPILAVLFALDKSWASILYALTAIASSAILFRARTKRGWERLASLLDVFAVAALPLAAVIVDVGKYFGAYVFLAAYSAFAAQRVFVAVRARNASITRVRIADDVSESMPSQWRVEEDLARFDETLETWLESRAIDQR